jgi:hypothetical protein
MTPVPGSEGRRPALFPQRMVEPNFVPRPKREGTQTQIDWERRRAYNAALKL